MNVALFDDIEAIGQYRSRLTERPKRHCMRISGARDAANVPGAASRGAFSGGRKARIDHEKCVLCGYCSASCPVFALKVY